MADSFDGIPVLSKTEYESALLADSNIPVLSKDEYEAALAASRPPPAFALGNQRAQAIGQGVGFGFFDEIEAGAKSAQDWFRSQFTGEAVPSYEQNLEQLRAQQEAYRQESPLEAMALETAAGVGTAFLPGLGAIGLPQKATKALGAVPWIGGKALQAAGVGAAQAGLAGFGEGEGGLVERLQLAAPAAATGATLGGAVGALTSLFKSPKTSAGEKLVEVAGKKIADLPVEKAGDPFYKLQTLAEVTQDPRLAMMQQDVASALPANSPLQSQYLANFDQRRALQKEFIEDLTGLAPMKEEQGGNVLRNILQRQQKILGDSVDEAYRRVDKFAAKQISKEPLFRWMAHVRSVAQANLPPKLENELFSEIISPSYPKTGSVGKDGKFATTGYLKTLQQKANAVYADADRAGDNTTKMYALQLKNKIDDMIGGSSKESQRALKEARRLARIEFKTFTDPKETQVGKVLKTRGGDYVLPSEKVPGVAWDGSPTATRKLLAAVGPEPADIQRAKSVIRDRILRESLDVDNQISGAKLKKLLNKYRDGLSTDYRGRKLFSKKELNNLQILSNEIDMLNPQSMKSIQRLANLSSRGQSPTAGRLLRFAATAGHSIRGVHYAVSLIQALGGAAKEGRERAVNEVLMRAFLNKEFAKQLTNKITEGSLDAITKAILRGAAAPVGALEAAGGTTKSMEKKTEPLELPTEEPALESPEPVSFGGFDLNKTLDAIRQVESGGGKFLKSSAGALGPYQFMPATAKAYGLDDPMDEEASREAARRLLQDELQALGDPLLAFAAYNAGRPAVLRAIEKAGTKNWVQVKNHLPAETRDYVPKVLRLIA